jgi:N-acetylmuramoyl-L-alanine amidase
MQAGSWHRISVVAGTLAIIFFMFHLFTQDMPIAKIWSWNAPLSGYTIVIDPGHGGVDPGAVSSDGILEKDITLAVAQQLRDYVQQAGAYVILTREDDRDLAESGTKGYSRRKAQDLRARLAVAKDNQADMLISIHLNSNPAGGHGAQVFFDTELDQSKQLATLIQAHFRSELNTKRDIEPQEDLYLLRYADIPAVLAEVGFLSNQEEKSLLKTSVYQKKVAYSMYQGILEYVSKFDIVR